MANYYIIETLNGLGNFTITAPKTANYRLNGTITLPTLSEGEGQSQVVVSLSVNGAGAIYTGVAGERGFYEEIALTAGDVLHINLASSAAADQGLNKIKTNVTLGEV